MLVISQSRDQGSFELYDGAHGKLTENRQQDHPQVLQADDDERQAKAEQDGEEEVSLFAGPLGVYQQSKAQEQLYRAQEAVARANAEYAYWQANPNSIKYVEHIVLQDDAVDMVLRDGVWEMPK